MKADSNAVELLWSGTLRQGEYSLYLAEDGQEYRLIDTLTTTEYTYKPGSIESGFSCYVVQKFENKTLQSNVLSVLYEDGSFVVLIPDADGDELYDFIEEAVGTDKDNADTDGDGLNDGYEYTELATNPLLPDTNGNGVSDADEDFDSDGLTNKEEMENGTNPFIADTDCDGLNDGEEVHRYGTNPIKSDTDGDLLPDGDEIRFGTDPFVKDTDGDGVQDGEEIYTVTLLPGEDIPNDGVIIPTLTMDLEGFYAQTLFVRMIGNDNPYINDSLPGYIGCGYDFNVSKRIRNDLNADITYAFDASLWDEEGFRPEVYYFNEDTLQLERVEDQEVQGNSVAFSVTHFSIYILLDGGKFQNEWKGILGKPAQKTYLSLVIDGSGSMSRTDPDNIRYTCSDTLIEQMGAKDEVAIVGFTNVGTVYQNFTTDKSAAKLAIRDTYKNGATYVSYAIRDAIPLYQNKTDGLKIMVVMTDGDSYYFKLDEILEDAVKQGIIIYTIGLGKGVNSNMLTHIAETTGGRYFFASKAEDLEGTYNALMKDMNEERYGNISEFVDRWTPKSTLATVVSECGFTYYDKQDILRSKLHPGQEKLGFCYVYDETAAVFISSLIDCEPIYFFYDGYEYLIEFWKGQYGIETGGEVGIYKRPVGEKKGAELLTGKWYDAVGSEEYPGMKFTLYNKSKIFEQPEQKHWWLTGFKWGILTTDPATLTMDINIVFPNAEMAEAFVKGYSKNSEGDYRRYGGRGTEETKYNNDDDGKYGLAGMGYQKGTEYTINGNEVHVIFDDTKAIQPLTRTAKDSKDFVNFKNMRMTYAYNYAKAVCAAENNDPNNFDKGAVQKISKEVAYNALVNMDDKTREYFIKHSSLSAIEKQILSDIIRNRRLGDFTDSQYEKIAECMAEEFAEAYVYLEDDMRSLFRKGFDLAGQVVEGVFKQ